MRIPFPERVNLSYALIFATALFGVQVLEGTNVFFACCVFCFIMIAAVGFNITGGFPFPSGAFIGFTMRSALSGVTTMSIPGSSCWQGCMRAD